MDRDALLQRLDTERRTLVHDGTLIDVREHITRLRATDGSHHAVNFSSLTDVNADDVIRAEIEHHRALNVPFEWKLFAHDAPADLRDRLVRHGFTVGAHEAVLVCDLSNPNDPPAWVNADDGIIVRRADDAGGVADYRAVAEVVFGKDFASTATQLLDAIAAGSLQHRAYVAYADGRPVSIGRLYTHPASVFGGLYGGGTLPAFRGRGFYRATVAARARDALARGGATHLLVDARPTSRPILEQIGFQHLTDTWPCEWRP
jgi:hypothetical protein